MVHGSCDRDATTMTENADPVRREPELTELARSILGAEERPAAPATPARARTIVWHDVRSVRLLAAVVQVLLALWVALGTASLVTNLDQRSLLQRISKDPFDVRPSELVASNDRVELLNGITIALFVITGICFIAWFATAYSNLPALGIERRFGTAWAVGGWFVPVLSWWRPKQLANDLWESVDAARGIDAQGSRSVLLGCWWAAWIASLAAATFAGAGDDCSLDAALQSNLWYSVRALTLVVAAILAIAVVRAVSRAQLPAAER